MCSDNECPSTENTRQHETGAVVLCVDELGRAGAR